MKQCVPLGMPYEAGKLYYAVNNDVLYNENIEVVGWSQSHRSLRKGEPVFYMGNRKVLVRDGVYYTLGGVTLCETLQR